MAVWARDRALGAALRRDADMHAAVGRVGLGIAPPLQRRVSRAPLLGLRDHKEALKVGESEAGWMLLLPVVVGGPGGWLEHVLAFSYQFFTSVSGLRPCRAYVLQVLEVIRRTPNRNQLGNRHLNM